jgi:hypothetical protein
MKTVALNNQNSGYESLKRFIYLFEVMIVGVVIPFFFFWYFDRNSKHEKETVVKEIVANNNQHTPGNVYEYVQAVI